MPSIKFKSLMCLSVSLLFSACGALNDQRNENDPVLARKNSNQQPVAKETVSGADSMIEDSSLDESIINTGVEDAVEALADADGDSGGGFALTADPEGRFTKTCTPEGDKAHVKVAGSFDRNRTFENIRRKLVRTAAGSLAIDRLWSKAINGAVEKIDCAGNHAAIDWKKDVTGLSLEARFLRQGKFSLEATNKVKAETRSWERSFSAEGTRNVSWDKQEGSATVIQRSKTIASEAVRKIGVQNSSGKDQDLEVSVATAAEKPLKVLVERDAVTLALLTKTIISGQLNIIRTGDGRIEVVFESLKLDLKTDCRYVSGTITTTFYKEGATEPSKVLKLVINQNDYVLTDSKGVERLGFALSMCEKQDFEQ